MWKDSYSVGASSLECHSRAMGVPISRSSNAESTPLPLQVAKALTFELVTDIQGPIMKPPQLPGPDEPEAPGTYPDSSDRRPQANTQAKPEEDFGSRYFEFPLSSDERGDDKHGVCCVPAGWC